jgi:tetratricopeptide (TPR) repeat protein
MDITRARDHAIALHQQGRVSDAKQIYMRILAAAPADLAVRHMLGVIRVQQGRKQEARELIGAVVKANPNDALALSNYSNVLNEMGAFEDALKGFDRVLALTPYSADAWNNRGNALQNLWRLQEALACYDKALALQPIHRLALNNRGNVLSKLRRPAAALADYDAALSQAPNFTDAHNNRGDVLRMMGRYDEALAAYDRVLALDPNRAGTWNNRGSALQNLKRLEEAQKSFRRASDLQPELPGPYLNQAICHLLAGDFEAGWPLFEWRKRFPDLREDREYPQPLWTGAQDIRGKTLLAYIDLGLGDAIHFYRYAALAQARGATVILEVNGSLLRLLNSANPPVTLIGRHQPRNFDYHIPLLSLPLALGATAIPATERYLRAEPDRVRQWARKIGKSGVTIGIAWQGNTNALGSEGKSFPVAALANIAKIPGVRLISLQKNAGAEQLHHLPPGMAIETLENFDEGSDAFLDSAAIMECLDLIITCDTALAHLAGALGVNSWLALKYVPEWRWFLDRADTPWYPMMRLFRQTAPGDWGSVFDAMEAEIRSAQIPVEYKKRNQR